MPILPSGVACNEIHLGVCVSTFQAFLVYRIPRNNTKKASLILKDAYNVGGDATNVDMIQSYIVGCQLPRLRQWLQLLFPSRTKFKDRDARAAYSIDRPEPSLYFALCTGSHSDPAVRVFTPRRVFEDLEATKEEYIQATFIVHKENKLLLPKIVESFAKDSDLCPAGLVEMLEHLLPECLSKTIRQFQYIKLGKSIEWIPPQLHIPLSAFQRISPEVLNDNPILHHFILSASCIKTWNGRRTTTPRLSSVGWFQFDFYMPLDLSSSE